MNEKIKHITFYWISFAFLRCANSNFCADILQLTIDLHCTEKSKRKPISKPLSATIRR